MNIVCIGDSLTTGYGLTKENCWVSLLNKDTDTIKFINKGVNGDTSIGILSRFFSDVISYSPEKCIIMCGSNDLIINKSVNSIIDNITLMVKDCINNKVYPIILSPPKISRDLAINFWSNNLNYDLINSKLSLLNDHLENFCKEKKLFFISLFNLIPSQNNYYTDGLHLSYESNKLIFLEIKNRLA
ncbi:MAG: GDSL-type esterase/lipase family protein [Sarcina sp.]